MADGIIKRLITKVYILSLDKNVTSGLQDTQIEKTSRD